MLDEFIKEGIFSEKNPLVEELENYVDDNTLIEDRNQAEYFTKLYKQVQKSIEDNKAAYKKYLKSKLKKLISGWKASINLTNIFLSKHVYCLKIMLGKNLDLDDKSKSLSLINGTIGLRAQQSEFTYEDDVIKNFLEQNYMELLIIQPVKIAKKALKKICKNRRRKFKN